MKFGCNENHSYNLKRLLLKFYLSHVKSKFHFQINLNSLWAFGFYIKSSVLDRYYEFEEKLQWIINYRFFSIEIFYGINILTVLHLDFCKYSNNQDCITRVWLFNSSDIHIIIVDFVNSKYLTYLGGKIPLGFLRHLKKSHNIPRLKLWPL